MCLKCVHEGLPDRGRTCLEGGTYFLNFKGCTEVRGRRSSPALFRSLRPSVPSQATLHPAHSVQLSISTHCHPIPSHGYMKVCI